MSELDDGSIAYRLRYPLRGATHRIMEPLELLARLAALVAPPRHPLVRYFGVLAPRSSWRKHVVPRPPAPPAEHKPNATTAKLASCCKHCKASPSLQHEATTASAATATDAAMSNDPSAKTQPPRAGTTADSSGAGTTLAGIAPYRSAPRSDVELEYLDALNIITTRHLDRLLGGELLATGPRLDWSKLMRRTYGIDLSICPRCSGPMKPIAVITDPAVIRRILDHLDRMPEPSSTRAARGPPPS